MLVAGKTDIGKKRAANQDCFAVKKFDNACGYVIVCDGMGGHSGGEVASSIAVKCLTEAFDKIHEEGVTSHNILRHMKEAVKNANKEVFCTGLRDESLRGMGTTVVCAYFYEDFLYITHVGDSRAYVLRQSGELENVTKDHSLVQEMIDRGEITREQAEQFPYKHFITRAVGTGAEVEVDADILLLKDRETLLLCSDGLSNMVSDNDLKCLLENVGNDPESVCDRLVDTANENGGIDNITIALLTRADR